MGALGMTQLEDDDPDAEVVKRIAQEIEKYLGSRAGAADTMQGVVQWWLMQQRVIETEKLVAKAIKALCSQGKVEKRQLPDGTDLFYCNNDNSTDSSKLNDG